MPQLSLLLQYLREPMAWVAAGGLILGACAPLIGDYLTGGEEDITLVDDDRGITIEVEEDDCSTDDGERVCDYDASVSGSGGFDGAYSFTLRYDGGNAITLLEAENSSTGASFDGEFDILPLNMREGDDESESEDGNSYSVEFDEDGETVEDADEKEWSRCDVYAYEIGPRAMRVDVSICPGRGITQVEIPDMDINLLRE